MNIQRITAVTLSVADLDVARRYYGALGWSEATGGNTKIAFYKMQGFFLSLYLRDALENDIGRPVQKPSAGAVTLATNFGSEVDVDAAFQKALEAGATQVSKPEKSFWGGYSAVVSDPDGHLWEYAHNPFWTLDENGYLADDG